MNLSRVNNLYGMYSNLFQSSMLVYGNRLTKLLKPVNKASTASMPEKDSFSYIKDLKTGSASLSQAVSALLSDDTWTKTAVKSSDPEVLTAYYDNERSGGNPTSFSVTVNRTASGQVNEGEWLRSASLFGRTGTYEFTIESGGESKQLTIAVLDGDTNRDIQQKAADAINSADMGINASVISDDETNKSALMLQSAGIGDDDSNRFRLTDDTGAVMSILGANNVINQPQNALYSINGSKQQSSNSNTVELARGVSVTFNKASEQPVVVSTVIEKEKAQRLVDKMTEGYNKLYTAALKNGDLDPKALRLFTRLLNASKPFVATLRDVGISFKSDGTMSVDDEKLDAAVENGSLEQLLTENNGRNVSFLNQLAKIAAGVTNNTVNYITSSYSGSYLTEDFSYSSSGRMLQYGCMTQGLLLDYTF